MSDTIISDKPVTAKKLDNVVAFAKEYAKIDACHFVEWAYREGWRQGPASFNWSNYNRGRLEYTTEEVYEMYEKRNGE